MSAVSIFVDTYLNDRRIVFNTYRKLASLIFLKIVTAVHSNNTYASFLAVVFDGHILHIN